MRGEDRRRGFGEGVITFGLIEVFLELLTAILEAAFSGSN